MQIFELLSKIFSKKKNEGTIEESFDVVKVSESASVTADLLRTSGKFQGYYVFPYNVSLLREYERSNGDFIAVMNGVLDLIFGTDLQFEGKDRELAESIFSPEVLMKVAKELFVTGNAVVAVDKAMNVVVVPIEHVLYRLDDDGWKILFNVNGEIVEPKDIKVVHVKVTPMVDLPFGIPPSLSLVPVIEVKRKLYDAMASSATLAKNPIFKVVTKPSMLNQLRNIFRQVKEGGINFIILAEGMAEIESVQPPNIRIENFIEAMNKELFRAGNYPDIEFFQAASKSSADTMFLIASMRAKRMIKAIERHINQLLRELEIDAVLVHNYFPHERPTIDLFTISQLADMGIISPSEVKQILVKAGILDKSKESNEGGNEEESGSSSKTNVKEG